MTFKYYTDLPDPYYESIEAFKKTFTTLGESYPLNPIWDALIAFLVNYTYHQTKSDPRIKEIFFNTVKDLWEHLEQEEKEKE